MVVRHRSTVGLPAPVGGSLESAIKEKRAQIPWVDPSHGHSADFQSAVSQNSILQSRGAPERAGWARGAQTGQAVGFGAIGQEEWDRRDAFPTLGGQGIDRDKLTKP